MKALTGFAVLSVRCIVATGAFLALALAASAADTAAPRFSYTLFDGRIEKARCAGQLRKLLGEIRLVVAQDFHAWRGILA